MTTTKTYWSILNIFYNDKKVAIIAELLINDKLISEFEVKANPFNNFFAFQCTPLDISCKIPKSPTYITGTKLSSIKVDNKGFINKIRSLSVGKAHDHDNISVRILKIYDSAIVEPLSILFNNCLNQSIFPDIWERLNIFLIHKKGDK